MRHFGTQGRVYPEEHYVVFDHRKNPEPQRETERVGDVEIRSYVIPVLQKSPSSLE